MESEFISGLDELNEELRQMHLPFIQKLQIFLAKLEGKKFDFEINHQIAVYIQKTLDRLGVNLECPREGCGKPAKLRCRKPGRSTKGLFQFDHPINGKWTTHYTSSLLPIMNIIPFENPGIK